MVRLRDGQTRRITVKADIEGRLKFKLDGDAYEVGITGATPEPMLALTGYRIESGEWATAGMPVKANVRFTEQGHGRFETGGAALGDVESPGADRYAGRPRCGRSRRAPRSRCRSRSS